MVMIRVCYKAFPAAVRAIAVVIVVVIVNPATMVVANVTIVEFAKVNWAQSSALGSLP